MEYPGTHFTRPWRLAFLTLFIAAFFIIAPLLVMYTSGYRYDFTNGIIKQTGAISIDVLPKNATAYLNDAKLDLKMPIRLKNVAPGKYKIKISADGFFDWEKDIQVENMQTIYIKEIKLIQKSDPKKIADGKINHVYLSKSNKFLLYQNILTSEFWLYDLTTLQERIVLKGDPKKNYEVDWSPKNDYAIIKDSNLSEVYILNTATKDDPWNLSKNEKNITKILWNNNSDDLYFSNKINLYTFDILSQQKSLVGSNSFIDWRPYNNQIWALEVSTTTSAITLNSDVFGTPSIFATINSLSTEAGNNTNWQIISIANNSALLKKNLFSEMMIVTANKQYNFFGDSVLLSPFNNWWIMWTPWELTTYSYGEEPFLLNRSGEQLRKVIILDEYNTLGLVWANKMTALFPYYFVSHNLINSPINDAAANNIDRILYFSGNLNGQDGLWKMNY